MLLPLLTSDKSVGGSPTARRASMLRSLRWRRVVLLLFVAVLCVFFWMQYTILSSNLGGAAHARTSKQGPSAIMRANNPTDYHGYGEAQLRREPTRKPTGTPMEDLRPVFGFDTLQDREVTKKPSSKDAKFVPRETNNTEVSAEEQESRRNSVVDAMRFAWSSYEKNAFGADEVDPKYGLRKDDVWGDIACSLVDGMDTLWVMGLKDEFARAREYVATSLSFDHLGKDMKKISVFETIIREVGGLLSAFSLSGDNVFKEKATELMDLLTPAFNEKEGVFYTLFNPYTKERTFSSWSGYKAHIADIGTLQLETRYLSDITKDPKYAKMGNAFYEILKREGSYKNTGLFPVHFNSATGKFHNYSSITFGALGDSFYEYLIKVYIYSGQRKEDAYLRKLYDDAVDGLEEHLLKYSEPDGLYYLQELRLPSMSGVRQMDHLLCFVPGMLALGTLYETQDHAKNEKHLGIAMKLMTTCYEMYRRQRTGLSPDIVSFPRMRVRDAKYKLRPEAVESLFYLYRVTKDVKYRNQGWEIFQSIEKHAKLKYGYGAVKDVTELPAKKDNKMESFFLAETLKYHFLLQADDDVLPLDEFVFNTEAHPLRIKRQG